MTADENDGTTARSSESVSCLSRGALILGGSIEMSLPLCGFLSPTPLRMNESRLSVLGVFMDTTSLALAFPPALCRQDCHWVI